MPLYSIMKKVDLIVKKYSFLTITEKKQVQKLMERVKDFSEGKMKEYQTKIFGWIIKMLSRLWNFFAMGHFLSSGEFGEKICRTWENLTNNDCMMTVKIGSKNV